MAVKFLKHNTFAARSLRPWFAGASFSIFLYTVQYLLNNSSASSPLSSYQANPRWALPGLLAAIFFWLPRAVRSFLRSEFPSPQSFLLSLLGGTSVAASLAFLWAALERGVHPLALVLLISCAPIWTQLLRRLLNNSRLEITQILAALCVCLSVLLVLSSPFFSEEVAHVPSDSFLMRRNLVGLACGFYSGLFLAFWGVFGRTTNVRQPQSQYVFLSSLFGFWMLVAMVVGREVPNPQGLLADTFRTHIGAKDFWLWLAVTLAPGILLLGVRLAPRPVQSLSEIPSSVVWVGSALGTAFLLSGLRGESLPLIWSAAAITITIAILHSKVALLPWTPYRGLKSCQK